MNRIKTGISIMLLTIITLLSLTACSNTQASGNSASIKATWIKPEIISDKVSIPAGDLDKYKIVHFKVANPTANLTFMAYEFDGRLFARPDICPPCRSENFSLVGGTLVCDTCGSVFDAGTGDGISGPCKAYPKASIKYEVKDGNVTMQGADLIIAFQNGLKPRKS